MKLIFYFHCRISGGRNVDSGLSINPDSGKSQFLEQIGLAWKSGLVKACDSFQVRLNGSQNDFEWIQGNVPDGVDIVSNGEDAESLLPTMNDLRMHAQYNGREDFIFGFAHTKGITRPTDALHQSWRKCMDAHIIRDWKTCVDDLSTGQFDAVGCHWITNGKRDDTTASQPKFFGGVYWWATGKYISTLPPLPSRVEKREDWYEPEWFIGWGNPRIKDYHPQWPNVVGCTESSTR